MATAPAPVYPCRAPMVPDPRVVIIDGYAFFLGVRSGHLVVREGSGEPRRIARLDAADKRGGVARIIILSHVGTVSMEAVRWCAAMGVAVFQVGRDGRIGFTSPGAQTSDARIIERQVLAPDAVRAAIMRELLSAKVTGQRQIAEELFSADASVIKQSELGIADAATVPEMMSYEGKAAGAYWRMWVPRVRVPWTGEALRYIPDHWQRFSGRQGVSSKANGWDDASNANATDFVNACLNYGYKVAETEAMYACHVFGIHPGIGIAHGTHDGKPGLALEILEPLRPIAERVVLSFTSYGQGHSFGDDGKPVRITKDCAYELDNGVCRLFQPMTSRLSSAVSMAVAPHAIQWAEYVVSKIAPGNKAARLAPVDRRIRPRPVTRGKLAPDVTVEDLVPGHVWEIIRPLLPERNGRGKFADTRTVLAGICAIEIHGCVPSHVSALGIDYRACAARLARWQRAGIWDQVRAELTRAEIIIPA